ncbi:MAG: hypothetical protein M0P70_19285 [Desulfobulbaceae bacterium]|nr:hypothetical protein [Desulfobulbaceae bacterium]
MNKKTSFAKSLRALASVLEGLEDKDIELVLAGKGKLVFMPLENQKDSKTKEAMGHAPIMEQLNECTDRNKARELLSSIANKEELTALAKAQKIHITKNDRREEIENKIIEFFIGAKLRTEAIQSLNMKGGGREDG